MARENKKNDLGKVLILFFHNFYYTEEVEETDISKCQKEASIDPGQQDLFRPSCETDGSYKPLQCYWEECWCVDVYSGDEIPGTRLSIQESGNYIDCSNPAAKPKPPKKP